MPKREKKTPLDETWSDDDVERIYQAYPRHVGKIAAKRAIRKAISRLWKTGTFPEDEPEQASYWLLSRVKQFAASPGGNNGVYVPHPATWFNRGSYDDDPAEWQRGSARVAAPPGKYARFEQ